MSNIKDVSQLAGVSVATVSRAFSAPEKVAPDTLKRVMTAAERLSYTPNSLAKSFRTNRANAVVVAVPDLSQPFFAKVLMGIEEAAAAAGAVILPISSYHELELEKRALEWVRAQRADGMIQLGARTLAEINEGRGTKDIPFVHAIESPDRSLSPSVRIDNTEAAEKIVAYLTELGHKRIGVVSGETDSAISRMRLDGFRNALNRAGIAVDETLIRYAPYTVRGGADATSTLLSLSAPPTALFCMCDAMAIGAIHVGRERGLKLPDQLSIVGFDDIELGEFTYPTLTTLRQPAREIGLRAMQMLLSTMEDPEHPPEQHTILATEIIIRDSTTSPHT